MSDITTVSDGEALWDAIGRGRPHILVDTHLDLRGLNSTNKDNDYKLNVKSDLFIAGRCSTAPEGPPFGNVRGRLNSKQCGLVAEQNVIVFIYGAERVWLDNLYIVQAECKAPSSPLVSISPAAQARLWLTNVTISAGCAPDRQPASQAANNQGTGCYTSNCELMMIGSPQNSVSIRDSHLRDSPSAALLVNANVALQNVALVNLEAGRDLGGIHLQGGALQLEGVDFRNVRAYNISSDGASKVYTDDPTLSVYERETGSTQAVQQLDAAEITFLLPDAWLKEMQQIAQPSEPGPPPPQGQPPLPSSPPGGDSVGFKPPVDVVRNGPGTSSWVVVLLVALGTVVGLALFALLALLVHRVFKRQRRWSELDQPGMWVDGSNTLQMQEVVREERELKYEVDGVAYSVKGSHETQAHQRLVDCLTTFVTQWEKLDAKSPDYHPYSAYGIMARAYLPVLSTVDAEATNKAGMVLQRLELEVNAVAGDMKLFAAMSHGLRLFIGAQKTAVMGAARVRFLELMTIFVVIHAAQQRQAGKVAAAAGQTIPVVSPSTNNVKLAEHLTQLTFGLSELQASTQLLTHQVAETTATLVADLDRSRPRDIPFEWEKAVLHRLISHQLASLDTSAGLPARIQDASGLIVDAVLRSEKLQEKQDRKQTSLLRDLGERLMRVSGALADVVADAPLSEETTLKDESLAWLQGVREGFAGLPRRVPMVACPLLRVPYLPGGPLAPRRLPECGCAMSTLMAQACVAQQRCLLCHGSVGASGLQMDAVREDPVAMRLASILFDPLHAPLTFVPKLPPTHDALKKHARIVQSNGVAAVAHTCWESSNALVQFGLYPAVGTPAQMDVQQWNAVCAQLDAARVCPDVFQPLALIRADPAAPPADDGGGGTPSRADNPIKRSASPVDSSPVTLVSEEGITTLHELVKRAPGRLGIGLIVTLARDVARALAQLRAHGHARGIRVDPGNVLLSDGATRAKLAYTGTAFLFSRHTTRKGAVTFDIEKTTPSLGLGNVPAAEAAELAALGKTIVYMVTGEELPEERPVRDALMAQETVKASAAGEELVQLCSHMLAGSTVGLPQLTMLEAAARLEQLVLLEAKEAVLAAV